MFQTIGKMAGNMAQQAATRQTGTANQNQLTPFQQSMLDAGRAQQDALDSQQSGNIQQNTLTPNQQSMLDAARAQQDAMAAYNAQMNPQECLTLSPEARQSLGN